MARHGISYMYIHMYVYVCVYMYMCIHVYIYIYTCIHIYIYTHTYTYMCIYIYEMPCRAMLCYSIHIRSHDDIWHMTQDTLIITNQTNTRGNMPPSEYDTIDMGSWPWVHHLQFQKQICFSFFIFKIIVYVFLLYYRYYYYYYYVYYY